MQTIDVCELHRDQDPYYQNYLDDDTDPPDYIEGSGHFEDLVKWWAKSLGYKIDRWSDILESDWDCDEYVEYDCKALGKRSFKAKLDEDEIEHCSYLVHAIINQPAWSIENDGSIKKVTQNLKTLCFWSDSNGQSIFLDTHDVGKCPFFKYYNDVYKKRKYRVDLSFYIEIECADEDNELEHYVEGVLHEYADGEYLEEALQDKIESYVDSEFYDNGTLTIKPHAKSVRELKR